MRVVGVIIKDGKILLIRRVKNGEEYYVFPGGSVEEGETQEEALKREMKEETGLDVMKQEKIFEIENRGNKETYYLIFDFSGTPELGGPEKERMNEQNQYYPEWFNLIKASELKNLMPREAVQKLRRLPETHPSPEYYKAIQGKRVSAGVMIFNDKNEILLVKPSYKDQWSVPGGIVEELESPREACLREINEEINIELKDFRFLCVEYTRRREKKDEDLFFLFYGGELDLQQIKEIKVDGDEVSDYKFAAIEEAINLLGKSQILTKTLVKCYNVLQDETALYLENGEF